MNKMEEKKGFTLIELLAVIVVLAIIMLIAATNVGGLMTKARINALMVEGEEAVNAAKLAYQMSILDGNITSGSACFSVNYLYTQNYFSKGSGSGGDNYTGSVLVEEENGAYNYKFWISNGTYKFENSTFGSSKSAEATKGATASDSCGGTGKKIG